MSVSAQITQAKIALARAKAKAAASLLANPNWKPTTHQAVLGPGCFEFLADAVWSALH